MRYDYSKGGGKGGGPDYLVALILVYVYSLKMCLKRSAYYLKAHGIINNMLLNYLHRGKKKVIVLEMC